MKSHVSEALRGLQIGPIAPLGERRAAFLGCGDSLSAARPAEQLGHRVISAGDIAWGGVAPQGVDVCVALSWSGRTGATIEAAQVCKDAGMPLISLTTDPDSPLSLMADEAIILPKFDVQEVIPALGYVLHSAAIMELCTGVGLDLDEFADRWASASKGVEEAVRPWDMAPQGITVVTMPDVHGAGEFWMLKLIEALGLSVRWSAVEEVGHVDYFIGPQAHLHILLSGKTDPSRLLSLGAALGRNGNLIEHVAFEGDEGWPLQILGGALGADWAETIATRWGRPPFRGGVVDMSAAHIQVQPEMKSGVSGTEKKGAAQ